MNKINEDLIIESFNNNLSITKIAKKYGISRQCVYNILNRKNVNYKKEDYGVDIDALKKDLKCNKMRDVMEKYNIPYSYLKKIMDEEKIQKREIMKDVLNYEIVKHLYDECDFSDEQIGNIFNCSPYTVRSFRWQNNIYDKNRNWQKHLTKNDFIKMRKSGLSLAEISRKTGYPYHIIIKAKQVYEDCNSNK